MRLASIDHGVRIRQKKAQPSGLYEGDGQVGLGRMSERLRLMRQEVIFAAGHESSIRRGRRAYC